MPTPRELEARFWKAVESDRTMMLGLSDTDDGHSRPMTAQIEDGRGPIWFYTSRESDLVGRLKAGQRAFAAFSAKDHDPFAASRSSSSARRMPQGNDVLDHHRLRRAYSGAA